MKSFILVAVIILAGCTDSVKGKFAAYGKSAHVMCYSGTLLIYDGNSSGKVANSEQSDGYYFVDIADGKLKEVSGNCIIDYGK